MHTPSKDIFKAYDIRGVVGKTLTAEAAELIGRAIGSEAQVRNVKAIVVGRDGRLSGPELVEALSNGIRAAGIDVIDVGRVATPMLYFAAYKLETLSGVMVTGSHNPPDYNGFKMMLAGETLAGDAIQALRQRIKEKNFSEGEGRYDTYDIAEAYLERITSDIKLSRQMNIVVDCGNGVPGAFAPVLFRRLGCRVRELFCDVDGTFPNHHPDPAKPENLQDVIEALAKTDSEIGLAFDGDGDRLGVVTKDGTIIWPDRQLMLFAADVLERHPGAKVIYDVKSTRLLAPWIREHGGEPVMCRTGHSFIKAAIKETGALVAGEMSGHVFFKERWYGFDDGLYAGARLLEVLSQVDNPSELLNALPNSVSTPELNLKMAKEGDNHELIAKLQETAQFDGADEVITIDGLRVEYPDGFGLARASNTTPVIVLRFEADNKDALERIKGDFRKVLASATDAKLPF
ncbi:phosphomannomutase/phosphoglucomutase [Crenobacter sp. SG2303]|uniref:Phosphomannomutase/phosphoglucomutase n=1 Tax=Crenobacter oryzisoli TaxID=3056844 RepID=A0ABT7XUC1_9NEIS|nr:MULTISPECIES: phosphomannomutase/phosphoglucomutase [unclassified Crenobacter]MDN0077333.1 phosphomannomutase/phosphoglucomutase [Crenobacter sp. SG2303]MDN0084708.1 phosphomannomutase/phosphoglucomutase [Crenobacter sp. SG2305]